MYTIEKFSAIKKNEILPFATTRMDLEGVMLSKIIQLQMLDFEQHMDTLQIEA